MKSSQRIILILKILETGQSLKRKEIARRLHTSIRTVYRDLSTLRNMNVPITNVDDVYTLNRRVWRNWTSRDIGQAIRKCRK